MKNYTYIYIALMMITVSAWAEYPPDNEICWSIGGIHGGSHVVFSKISAMNCLRELIDAEIEAKIVGLKTDVQNGKNDIGVLQKDTTQLSATTTQLDATTASKTTLLDASLATAETEIKELKTEHQAALQLIESLQKQLKNQADEEKIHLKRKGRIYDTFSDIFEQGKIQDPGMAELFSKASELSPEFKTLFEDLRRAPAIRQIFRQKAYRLEELLETMLKENKEMAAIIDDYAQYYAIGGDGGDNLLRLNAKPNDNELNVQSQRDEL